MNKHSILALSSSRVGNSGYLENVIPYIQNLLGSQPKNIAFIPFASADNDYDEYTLKVKKGLETLPHNIHTVLPAHAKEILQQADVIMVGGGNTFKLLHDIYALKLLDIIRDKVDSGIAYIGWSAGANILGPGIGTTNDMPIIEPKSFSALGLFPFQINPHYNNASLAGHNGETRDQRLEEFMKLNPGLPIVGLPEGTALKLENNKLELIGQLPAVLITSSENNMIKKEIEVHTDLSYLL